VEPVDPVVGRHDQSPTGPPVVEPEPLLPLVEVATEPLLPLVEVATEPVLPPFEPEVLADSPVDPLVLEEPLSSEQPESAINAASAATT
jgi:hypothetical protein